ncbi:uncharacterized protein SCHCODRAFT_02515869 [Schizophyllum commune H4-8]|nr:uncharacterized protein SCHCODRAFT_02515869 [Schizophyllum commune H4-8]KAI5886981.1 hypothetical protein SCHCODRAFT_02515869 [Schizophyllum commune H4-8]
MAHIVVYNNRETISIPLGAIDLPPSPFEPSSVADEEQTWSTVSDECGSSGLLSKLRQLDRRSLFTGSIADLEVTYLIPPPTDGDDASRARLESLCNGLKLGGNDETFRLDGLMNTFLLESSLRVNLDAFATFMIHMPLLEFARLCDQLRRDNEAWAERAKHNPGAERILGSANSYEIQCLSFYALSPAFLPNGATIPILPNEHRTLDRPCPHAVPDHQRPRHALDHICEFPYPPTYRERNEKLSPLALAVNAHFKLQTWKAREFDTSDNFILEQYCKFSDMFMDLLYFVPSVSPRDSENPAPSLVPSTARDSSALLHLGTSFTIATVDDLDDDYDDDYETDSDENTGYDLTAEEVAIVSQRASDGSLGDTERAEAAMLLIGMAGYTLQPDNPLATRF